MAKKVTKTAVKKAAVKTATKKVATKKVAVKKVVVKKAIKPVPKKVAPKKAIKVVASKTIKKVVAKKSATKPVKKAQVVVKKVAPKKAVKVIVKKVSKPISKKAMPSKVVAKKAAPAKTVAKKAAVKKVVAKKAAPAKTIAKKAAVKKVVAKKSAPAKTVAKKAAVKKVVAKKVVAKTKPVKTIKPIIKKTGKDVKTKLVVTKTPVFEERHDELPPIQKDSKRYSDDDLKEFKELINRKLTVAKEELNNLLNQMSNPGINGGNETDGSYNKLEDGASTSEKEYLSQLAARQRKFIENLENALIRIENKTYGICKVTGKLISKERLRAVPHTTLSMEAKLQQYK
jgi:RNA polymerase-binding transcription factor DksA